MTTIELLNRFGIQNEGPGWMPLAMFHLHTRWSHDSTLHPKRYFEFANKHEVGLICITDHGTTKGSRDVACYLADTDMGTYAPLGMEAYAKEGHLGCIGIQEDITARFGKDIVKEVTAQGGLSVYNHPYQGGRIPDMGVAEEVDFIEYPNNRTSPEDNYKALRLAIQLHKPVLPGADVHQEKELFHALVHLAPKSWGQDILATPLPAIGRTYMDKISEIFLKKLKIPQSLR